MMYMGRSRIRLKNCLTPRNKLLLLTLVNEDDSCLLHAVYLTASIKVPASVKTQLSNSTLFNLSLEN